MARNFIQSVWYRVTLKLAGLLGRQKI